MEIDQVIDILEEKRHVGEVYVEMSPESMAILQHLVDDTYTKFIDRVVEE